jgi:hypothetical protein
MKSIFFQYITPIFFTALFIPTIIRVIKMINKKNANGREKDRIVEPEGADTSFAHSQFSASPVPPNQRAATFSSMQSTSPSNEKAS